MVNNNNVFNPKRMLGLVERNAHKFFKYTAKTIKKMIQIAL